MGLNTRKLSLVYKYFRRGLVPVAVFFFVKVMLSYSSEFSQMDFSIKLPVFAAGFALMLASYLYIALIWHLLTREFGMQLPFRVSLLKWSASQFARYIPGFVFVLASRVADYSEHSLSKEKVATAYFLENAVVMLSVFLVFLLFGWTFITDNAELNALPYLVVPVGVVVLSTGFPKWFTNRTLRILKRDEIKEWPESVCMMKCLVLGVVAFLQSGYGFYLIITSLQPLAISSLPLVIGAYAGSGVVNLLVFFVPGGLGVRDGALAYFLSYMMPVPAALLLSVICRVVLTASELVVIIVAWIWCRIAGSSHSTDREGACEKK
jgi:uncharacterized membrane protein YbhN (UPF0104 family)